MACCCPHDARWLAHGKVPILYMDYMEGHCRPEHTDAFFPLRADRTGEHLDAIEEAAWTGIMTLTPCGLPGVTVQDASAGRMRCSVVVLEQHEDWSLRLRLIEVVAHCPCGLMGSHTQWVIARAFAYNDQTWNSGHPYEPCPSCGDSGIACRDCNHTG